MTKFTALVPMKGNSERVPNKNIRDLNGKPACNWILNTLQSCDCIDQIIVNTDSDEIRSLCNKFEKIEVIKRPNYLLGDAVSIQPLIEHDLQYSQNEHIIQTHATNPIIRVETINNACSRYLDNIETKRYDTLFSVTPIQNRFYYKDGRAINHDPENLIQTQLLEPIFEENSCFYIFSKANNELTNNRIGKNPDMFEMNVLESADIDNWEDFYWAEFLLKSEIYKQ